MRLDLQFRSIVAALTENLQTWPAKGRLLDFGSGAEPYRQLLKNGWKYTSVDIESPTAQFRKLSEVPGDDRFDRIWVIEVLEHIENPQSLLRELREKLSADGELWLSVPFSARIHPYPNDYLRWTPEALTTLLEGSGYKVTSLKFRGSDFSTVMSKLIYFFARRLGFNFSTIAAILLSPALLIGVLICQMRSHSLPTAAEDPLGLVVTAKSSVHTNRK